VRIEKNSYRYNLYASFKRSESVAVEELRRAEYVGINMVVLGEILSGFKDGRREEREAKHRRANPFFRFSMCSPNSNRCAKLAFYQLGVCSYWMF
jgi:hypothetical protein